MLFLMATNIGLFYIKKKLVGTSLFIKKSITFENNSFK